MLVSGIRAWPLPTETPLPASWRRGEQHTWARHSSFALRRVLAGLGLGCGRPGAWGDALRADPVLALP